MSANPEDDLITVEIDGQEYKAHKGQMIIEITDAHGIDIPRFCYHKKLPIAANCRMCLVQVEKAPKPLPACATPVMDGMKIYTHSDYARDAQKAVMEFLLINHPLDCPICDQGGECELQDMALGYGRDVSRFAEKKRVVPDKNIGPLVATDMTRCIHCTRCVRFMEEIAGFKELGGTGRGERVEIGTYVERSLESEMSGNIIDVCPVGALTSKPFRFRARAWEMTQHATVAAHDCVGSNLWLHSRRGQVMRAVPRENEPVNEVWISDRDRFSYQGLYAEDRLQSPMIKENGSWREADWDEALQAAADGLRKYSGGDIGVLASPSATTEEHYLLASLCEAMGWPNKDHRLRQQDFSNQEGAPLFPNLGQSIEDLELVNAALIVGGNPRKEQPIIGHRIRKAARRGAKIMFVNPVDYSFTFDVAHKSIVPPSQLVTELASVAKCLGAAVPSSVQGLVSNAQCGVVHQGMANALKDADRPTVLLGLSAQGNPAFSALIALGRAIASSVNGTFGTLSDGANSAGACIAGMLPHRAAAGAAAGSTGLDASAMMMDGRKAYLLFNVEPEFDCGDAHTANQAVNNAGFVVAVTPFASQATKHSADVLLPIGGFAETSGTFVNCTGEWQSFPGAVAQVGDGRPGWKVLRVLGNVLGLDGFEYLSSDEVRDELHGKLGGQGAGDWKDGAVAEAERADLERVGDACIYGVDSLVRRGGALQQAEDGPDGAVHVCSEQAGKLGLADGDTAKVSQNGGQGQFAVVIDERVPNGAARILSAQPVASDLGPNYGPVEISKA